MPAPSKQYCVYILASRKNGMLYIGVTSDLVARIWKHRNGVYKGFTHRYSVHTLVYYEIHGSPDEMIRKEKRLKKWKRQWKIDLIERANPSWSDLCSADYQILPPASDHPQQTGCLPAQA